MKTIRFRQRTQGSTANRTSDRKGGLARETMA